MRADTVTRLLTKLGITGVRRSRYITLVAVIAILSISVIIIQRAVAWPSIDIVLTRCGAICLGLFGIGILSLDTSPHSYYCSHCTTYISRDVTRCPHCGCLLSDSAAVQKERKKEQAFPDTESRILRAVLFIPLLLLLFHLADWMVPNVLRSSRIRYDFIEGVSNSTAREVIPKVLLSFGAFFLLELTLFCRFGRK